MDKTSRDPCGRECHGRLQGQDDLEPELDKPAFSRKRGTKRAFQADDHQWPGCRDEPGGSWARSSRMWIGTVCILIRFEKSLQETFLSFPSIMDYLKQGPLFFIPPLVHQSRQINRISAKSYMCPSSFLAGIYYVCLFLLPLHPGLGQDAERMNIT